MGIGGVFLWLMKDWKAWFRMNMPLYVHGIVSRKSFFSMLCSTNPTVWWTVGPKLCKDACYPLPFMKLHVRLHNSVAVTGLLRCINLFLQHIHRGGQISWSWPWSTGFINHNLMRQKWCHIEPAGRSTYQSRYLQGWSDPWWLMSLITLHSAVTHSGI